MRLDKLFFETPWSWSCFEARPGLKQDQDQDLLVHQDQDQDQGLAQELPGTFRELPVGSFCCIIGTLGERRANQDKEKLKENKGL